MFRYIIFTTPKDVPPAMPLKTKQRGTGKFYKDKLEDRNGWFYFTEPGGRRGKKMAEALKVSGQTLLLVKGEHRVNLTNDGFMNARTNPEKFQKS